MNIETVKDLENSYLVNGSTTVPKDSTNSDYKKVQDWIAEGNTPDPEFTPAELLENAKKDKIAEIKKAKEIDLYLNVSYNNKDFISSEKAVSNMTGAIILDQDNYNWLEPEGRHNWDYERLNNDPHPSFTGHIQLAEHIKNAIKELKYYDSVL